MNKLLSIVFLTFVSNFAISQQPRYRFILPPTPPQPPILNNTVQAQISNQNINFNTGSSSGFGGGFGGGGFQQNTGGIQGTAQYTQNNTPGMQISKLYQIPLSTGGGFSQGGGQFGQGGGGNMVGGQFGQGGGGNMVGGQFGQGGGVQAIGMNNPFYQMAMQGIMSGVGGSAFQSGGGGNIGGGQFGQGNMGGFGQFGGGFNNGGNGI